MRILYVVPSFGLGGMEKILCTVINNAAKNQQHAILTLDGCATALNWVTNARVEIIPFQKANSRLSFFLSLYNVLRDIQPDLLMTYNWGATDAIWLGRLAGISNIVHHEHGFNVDEGSSTAWRRDLIRFTVYRLVTRLIVVSHDLEEMLQNRFRLSKSLITRIPNGIDTSFYSPNEHERHQMRKSLGYEDAHLVIGFSGRLDPVKNLDMMLDIFLSSNPRDYPFRLMMVGDGPDRAHLEARCQAAGVNPYVKFAGQQREVLQYLRAMDVFLLTSLREQMPLTVLEAMAVGVPVIATRVGELPYIIDDGNDGFIRDLNASIETFVHPLRSLLCSSQRKRLSDAARKKVIEQFQLETMIERYANIIQVFDPDIGQDAKTI
jgi:glycosyltransferase involved in cell wall biosynthesis